MTTGQIKLIENYIRRIVRKTLNEVNIPYGFLKLNGPIDLNKVKWGESEIIFHYNGQQVQDILHSARKENGPIKKFIYIVSNKYGRNIDPSDVIAIKY